MIISSILLAYACLCSGVRAQIVLRLNTPSAPNSVLEESRLKEWLEHQPRIRGKLSSVIKRAEAAKTVPSDLRDAVASRPSVAVQARIALAGPAERKALLEGLPGMKPDSFTGCRTLKGCPQAPLALYADRPDLIEDSIAALIRPWILLQKARGQKLDLIAAKSSRREVMKLSLEGLPGAVFRIYVSALPSGRFVVRLRGQEDPAALYSSERFTALALAER